MFSTDIYQLFSQGPTLAQVQARLLRPVHSDWDSLIHVFVKCYKGSEAIPILKWLQLPPHSESIETPCRRDNGTPLMMASYIGNIDMMRTLVICGANVNAEVTVKFSGVAPNGNRTISPAIYTVLDYALHGKNYASQDAVIFLIDHGARKHVRYSLPEYAEQFLVTRKRLANVCLVILGMRFRRPLPFDRWLLPIIAHLVWTSRFTM